MPDSERVSSRRQSVAPTRTRPLSGWGRNPVVDSIEIYSEDLEAISENAVLSRGLGRAYADSALPPEGATRPLAVTTLADRILDFDAHAGVVRAEAGLSLVALHRVFLPRGWFAPVTPGTQHVTLGGMVASDVHGKNHHVAGCFGGHVRALRMRVADGRVLEVDERSEPELLLATQGGMGLTGHVLEVAFGLERVPSPWIWEESERLPDIEAVMERLCDASRSWPMTVAWVDTTARGAALGRGILMKGRWARPEEAPARPPLLRGGGRLAVPFELPSGLINAWSIRALNSAWFARHGRRERKRVVHPESYFYPLDAVRNWNRAYGRRGFAQYQCVLPSSARLYREFLERFQRFGGSSFVSILKDCGPESEAPLSFPRLGTSIALDIPGSGERVRRLVGELNAFVIGEGGRIYLAKDAFTTADQFRAMYPRFPEWNAVRRKWDPDGRLMSAQSVRLLGDLP